MPPHSPRDKLRLLISKAVPIHGSIIHPRDTHTTRQHRAAGNGAPGREGSTSEEQQEASSSSDGGAGMGEQHAEHDVEGPAGPPSPVADHQMETGCLDPVPASHRQRSDQEDLWASRREELQQQYLVNLTGHWDRTESLKAAAREQAEAAVEAASKRCRSCAAMDDMEQVRAVQVLWVGWDYTFLLDVPIISCQRCGEHTAAQPLEAGCFPSTPVQAWDLHRVPVDARPLWFDLCMLETVDTVVCVLRRSSMDRVSELILRNHERHGCADFVSWDTFRKQLQVAVTELGYITCALADMRQLGATDYPAGLFSSCGGCWFSGREGKVGGQHHDSAPLHSANIDFCFKVPRLRRSRGAAPGELLGSEPPPNQRYFIADREGLAAIRQPAVAAPEEDKLCSDFKADEYDITSLGVLLCRHGFVGSLLNSFTGERHAYATLFVEHVLRSGIRVQFVWYDINCRWAASFQKWLREQPLHIQQLAHGMQCPLPPFHKYAHSVECQRQNSALGMVGAGRGNGEPHETFNAHIGPLGKTTMYMTPTNRMARIERVVLQYTEDKALRMPELLLRMDVRAQAAKAAAVRDAAAVLQRLRASFGLSEVQVMDRMRRHAEASSSGGQLEMPWEAKLAYSMLVVHKAELTEGDASTPGLALLFEDPAFEKLSPGSPKVRAALAAVRRITAQHAEELSGLDLEIGSEGFEELLAEFIEHTVQELQLGIEKEARQRMDTDALMPSLAERAADQTRLRKSLQRSAAAILKKATRLQAWLTGDFVAAELLSAATQQLAAGAAAWDLDGFCQGRFPWQEDALMLQELSAEQLVSKLLMHNRQHARANEELQLIAAEKELCMRLYDAQLAAIRKGTDENCAARAHAVDILCGPRVPGDDLLHAREYQRALILGTRTLLLEKKATVVAAVRAAAERAFAGSASAALQHGDALPRQYVAGPALDDDSDEDSDGEE